MCCCESATSHPVLGLREPQTYHASEYNPNPAAERDDLSASLREGQAIGEVVMILPCEAVHHDERGVQCPSKASNGEHFPCQEQLEAPAQKGTQHMS